MTARRRLVPLDIEDRVLPAEWPDPIVEFLEPGDRLKARDHHVVNLLMLVSLGWPEVKAHNTVIVYNSVR